MASSSREGGRFRSVKSLKLGSEWPNQLFHSAEYRGSLLVAAVLTFVSSKSERVRSKLRGTQLSRPIGMELEWTVGTSRQFYKISPRKRGYPGMCLAPPCPYLSFPPIFTTNGYVLPSQQVGTISLEWANQRAASIFSQGGGTGIRSDAL